MIDEASRDPGVIELRGWVSPRVKTLPGSRFQPSFPSNLLRFIPKWIRRAILAKSLGEGWIILNLTNFPISKLAIRPGVTEVCLFHNAYFMASPTGIHSPIPFYFVFRQIFLRRTLLRWLMLFYDERRTKLVVQSHFMAKLSTRIFGKKKVQVAALHVPPMMDSSELTGKLDLREHDLSRAWFYPASAEPHKNHLLLVDICEKSVRAGGDPRIFLTITPKTSEERFILDSIEKRGLSKNIINLGWVSEAERQWLTSNCRGVLFFSTFESLGISLLEARFLGCRILCVDSPLAREMLGENFSFYDVARLDEQQRLADDLTVDVDTIPIAPCLVRPHRIIDSYCFNFIENSNLQGK
jgi:glycosyltransferase involved in cell wall biosynthesis